MKLARSIQLFLTIVLATTNLSGQEKNRPITETGRIKSFVGLNLLSPFNMLNPRLGAGFVYGINERWKLGVDLGYGYKKIDIYGEMGENYRLWEVRPELYYFISPWRQHERYFSAELFYINHKDVFYNKLQYDQADYQRHKYGFHLKYGMIFRVAKHLGLNFYIGFGLRIRSNSYSNEINPVEVKDLRDFHIDGYKDFEEVKTGVDFSLGLKLIVF